MSRRGSRGAHGGPTVAISKALSYTLRHGAVKEGLKMRDDGYANVADLVRALTGVGGLDLCVGVLTVVVALMVAGDA